MVGKVLSQLLAKEGEDVFFFTTPTRTPTVPSGQEGRGSDPDDSVGKPTGRRLRNVGAKNIFQIPALASRSGFFRKLMVPFYLFAGTISAILYFKKNKPDIVNFLRSNYLFIPVMTACRFLKIPTVFTFLDYYMICDRGAFLLPNGEICDQLEGEICKRCISKTKLLERRLIIWLRKYLDGIITFTETSRQRLIKAGFLPEKIRVIYTYTLPKEFKNKAREKIPNSAFIVASFHEHKGLHIVLQAWQKVLAKIPEARLTVVGSGPKEDNTRIDGSRFICQGKINHK